MCAVSPWQWERSKWTWPVNQDSLVVFLEIPASVDLTKQQEQRGVYNGPASIANLPPELQCMILEELPPVDRVCLALSCKSLAATAVASPHLIGCPWTPWNDTAMYSYYPSKDLLLARLAHGWIDKSRMRYCQTCRRILPKNFEWFQKHLIKPKKLPYSIKVGMGKKQWNRLSMKKKQDYVIRLWTESKKEDGSVFSCNRCWMREYGPEADTALDPDLEQGHAHVPNKEAAFTLLLPVECPFCLVRGMLHAYKEPRKPVLRPFLWKWTKRVMSFLGNSVLVFVYLLYLMFKAPFDLTRWVYKKCQRRSLLEFLC